MGVFLFLCGLCVLCGEAPFRDERNQNQRGEHETHTVEQVRNLIRRRHALHNESRPPDDGYDEEKYVCFEAHEEEESYDLLSFAEENCIMVS